MTSNSKLSEYEVWVDCDIQSSVDETYNPRNLGTIRKKVIAFDKSVVDFLQDNQIKIEKKQPLREPRKIDLIDIKTFHSDNTSDLISNQVLERVTLAMPVYK